MDLPETLMTTLEKTKILAEALEFVGYSITPRRMSIQSGRRLMNINREILNFQHKSQSEKQPSSIPEKKSILNRSQANEIINDSPGYLIKKKLSTSIKEINDRVKMSRAGKRTIGGFIASDTSPLIIRNVKNLSITTQSLNNQIKHFKLNELDEKPQPYVPLTTGRIEDPVILPTFNEFLSAKGAEFVIRKGNEELFYRIQKASEKLSNLKTILEAKLTNLSTTEDKKRRFKGRNTFVSQKIDLNESEIKKNQELRKVLNQYYEMPPQYSHRKVRSLVPTANSNLVNLSVQAEGNLEESLRDFYRSKAMENKKLSDILEKISKDRPFLMKEKVNLIQIDKEKYKNKNHSIEKFNYFRSLVEQKKRNKQHKNMSQGLAYLEILEEFKKRKYEPSEPELLVLELWRRVIESGWVITSLQLKEMTQVLTEEECELKPVKELLDRLYLTCDN